MGARVILLFFHCVMSSLMYNIREKMAGHSATPLGLRSLAAKQEGNDTFLFFFLPTLVVGAVLAFCALARSSAEELPVSDEQESALKVNN